MPYRTALAARALLPKTADQAPDARLFRSGKAKTRGDKRPKTTRRDTGTTRERTRAVSIYMAGCRNTRDKRGTRTAEKKATNAHSGSNRGRRKRRSERSLRRRERATRRQVRGQCMQRPLRSRKTMFAAAFSCVQRNQGCLEYISQQENATASCPTRKLVVDCVLGWLLVK